MYLKSMELLGFKSFSTKTRISFEPGVSCIVGPNGSGKSNIADAFRWVLGESSARNIRGAKLEDVIFSGSGKRRPLGMAEVTVCFDNSDGYLALPFTEISVTRRAVRGGGSDYFINNEACRLKDIRDLFVDTGIGVEGLSLINQGRVQELVAARPEERRELVEEAAGIVRYRDRKRESLRRLAETERHLERVGDIINELGGRIDPLARAAEKAARYLELKKQYDRAEIGVSVRVLSEAGDKLAQLHQQAEAVETQLTAGESERLSIAAQAEQLAAVLSKMDEETTRRSEAYFGLQTQSERTEGERRLAQSQMENAAAQAERLRAELETIEKQIAQRTQAAAEMEQHAAQTKQECDALAAGLESETGDALREQAAALSLKTEQQIAALAALSADRAAAQTQADLRAEAADKLREAQQQQREQVEQIEAEQTHEQQAEQQASAQTDKLRDQCRALSAQLHECEQNVRRSSAQSQDLAATLADAKFRHHSAQTRLALMTEMASGYEGFFPGVKSLMSAHSDGKAPAGVRGVIAELMDVPEQYRVAAEAYLGANIQNIVTANADSAAACVEYLKRHKLGRATFLPLDILQVRSPQSFADALKLPGVIGRVSDLIDCAADIRPAVDFLLNNVLLTQDMDSARAAAKALRYKVSVVTLEGDLVNPGATISGGSRGAKAGELLSRKARLDEAKSALAAAQKEVDAAQSALTQAREQSAAAEQQREQIATQLSDTNRSLSQRAAEQEQAAYRRELLAKRQQEAQQEHQRITGELAYAEETAAEAEGESSRLTAQERELEAELTALREALAAAEQEVTISREELTGRQVRQASLTEKLHGQQLTLAQYRRDAEELGWEAEGKSSDLRQQEQAAAAAAEQISALGEALLSLGLQLKQAEQELSAVRQGLAAENDRLRELNRQERELQRTADQQRGELHQLQIKQERWQADYENEAAKLRETYALDLVQARQQVGELPARTVLITQAAQLKRDIAALGNVNLDSIQEYAETRERYDFLTAQRDDLVQARQSLNSVIEQMDKIMSVRFRETFSLLSDAFDQCFRRMFNGGKASLSLTDPTDMLETGVELVVSLPGKKVSNYNLLSGGEKTLIGVALMFAVLTVRPTPVCLMDEVDAALDEANIDRFTVFLREKSERSQFVIISHRQSTMEAANTLWGVTMEEEGVSKVISVRLTEQHTPAYA